MKRNLKRVAALGLGLVMAFPMAASAEGGVPVSAKGELPIVEEPVTLKVFMAQEPSVIDYEDNKLTKYLEEQTGIHVEWELVSVQDKEQKLNLMLASGEDLPDIIMGGISNDLIVQYADQGVFMPINDLLEEHSAYYKDVLANYPGMEEILTAPDGSLYSFQQVNDSVPNSYSIRCWINQTWLDTLGLETPKTKDEFMEVLRAFKEKDPNGNGVQDEIPVMGSTNGWHSLFDQWFITNYIPYNKDDSYLIDKDGKVTATFMTEQYREGLIALNQMIAEGLYDPSSYTQENEQLKQAFEAGLVGVIPGGGPNSFANLSGEMYRNYVPLAPIDCGHGQMAYHNKYSYLMYRNTAVITTACENPEAAVKWLDYMFTEDISMRGRLGEPEVDWIPAEEGKVGVDGQPALYTAVLNWGEQQQSHWAGYMPYMENFADRCVATGDPYELQQYLWDATKDYYQPYTMEDSGWNVVPGMMYEPDDAKKLNEIMSVLKNFVNENRAQFTTGAKDPSDDGAWEAYLEELKKIGVEDVINIYQARYDELYKAE